jgi:ABC-type phosphate/phosphonate transport system permease subunit
VLVALTANAINQLDTKPGRALKAFALGWLALAGKSPVPLGVAVLLAPYDLREMAMLGDAGSNALGAVLGLESVRRLRGWQRYSAIGALGAITYLGERRSLGSLIESSPGLKVLDSIGRQP